MGERMDNHSAIQTTGSQWLLPVSEYWGFPLALVNFLACQLFALSSAFWFRLYLSRQHSSPLARHAVATLLGVTLIIFCFGWYSTHLLAVVLANYLILIQTDISNVHRYSMVVAMGYLIVCHVSRVFIFKYGILSTDFSGPLMVVTQKITSLAFQLHDGMCKKAEELTSEQKLLAITARPSLIEYLSYNLNFLSVLVGPFNNYKDYIDFIEGTHISGSLRRSASTSDKNGFHKSPDPSPLNAVCQKLLVCCGCMIFFLIVTQSLPIEYNVNPHFVSHAPFITRLIYALFSIQAARIKFYFAWTLGDAISNAAGFGFSGMDENGKASWSLLSNLNVVGVETATSFKAFIDNWNIQTGNWLKTVCYDRVPRHRLVLTFILSALWHGVYPGYYFTFLTGILMTLAARAVRKSFRPYFLGSSRLKLGYDILTWASTQMAICYTVMPFLLLATESTMVYYRSMYFHMHIFGILATIVLYPKLTSKVPSAATRAPSTQCLSVHRNNNDKTH
ncbi:lysophospholipid acyltransferase 1 [Hippocampus comes]|uniref:Membrane bound O-acyltransferase domain containing 1 n=1 Tax=Hippocampus comes TaxID=109280 RepID=A0A3Q3DX07_HIPCM|nr:PREDICTED: lysophospholipid acyltransferase 1 [Hippocampus comes]